MGQARQVDVPGLVRIKPGALERLGLSLARGGHRAATLVVSAGLPLPILETARASLDRHGVVIASERHIDRGVHEVALDGAPVVVGLGGGHALDVAKLAASRAGVPFFSVPTSLSNDGFASPRASVVVDGRRLSLPCAMPSGVVIDTAVCAAAPVSLWHAGIGDVAAKVTAVHDWRRAFHTTDERIDDLALLTSDATVFQLQARPTRDVEGMRLLATALLLSGVAMAMAGSSRPASGSEHLISHALDAVSDVPRSHGLQVGVAAWLISQLQEETVDRVSGLLLATDFFASVRAAPFSTSAWLDAVLRAPALRPERHTILHARADVADVIARRIATDPVLFGCFGP